MEYWSTGVLEKEGIFSDLTLLQHSNELVKDTILS
jgi:hypothetical protein